MWQPGQCATSSETECLNAHGCSLSRALERGPQPVLPSFPSILDWILPGCRLKGRICDDATLYKESTPGGTCRAGGEQGMERRERPSRGGFQVKPQALHEPLGSPSGKMTPEFVPHQGAPHTVTMDGVP